MGRTETNCASTLNSTADLPRPHWMSKRHREYLHRLQVRKGLLDIRIGTSSSKDTQDMVKERNALEWAITKLSAQP